MENTQDLNDNDGDDQIGLKQLDSPKHGASSLACEHIQGKISSTRSHWVNDTGM